MKKENSFSIKDYIIKVLNGMALGLFSSLIIGLILKQIGTLLNIDILINMGQIAQYMMGPAIGAGVAYSINAPALGIFASIITGALGAGTVKMVDASAIITIGEPVGALVASLIGAEISKIIKGKTKVDIVLVPALTILLGGMAGVYIAPIVSSIMTGLGELINLATEQEPIPMGILVSVLMGVILTLPISSAALAISLGLSGLAAGAATVGCATQMIGFAVASFRENGIGGLISQGLGTSMLQIPNIVKNPRIWIPPIITSAILGPIATVIFRMENNKLGAGMGTSGLVGQFGTLDVMGREGLVGIVLLHFVLPAILTLIISEIMRRKGWIKEGDMKIEG
ncbi:PTS sugar transporter subunit IIC [Clostridium sp. D2Q-11]|uniref:PTS sugar transporter subunit IIC n=1 Tax=Anaeromonas frigoriresistens TaxID=2683708 RepID=A0A942Z9S9_9FIRM|nr:PTS sugar transporter subunit IIC [Anaeromonas frigoriresistens]MBS4539150.1 PTS sugar transporter subunit IIC [Anaeromonas frigoriresistens]